MGLDPGTVYHACDIDHRLMASVNAFLARLGQQGAAQCKDLIAGMPDVAVDVAFLLKTLPCLEQQEKGIGVPLLRAVPARSVVVSFPLQSLGGRHKGMRSTYHHWMGEILGELGTAAREFTFPNEAFYVLSPQAPP
jgi:16S rRNA (guanine(1405)-N(7))-methyltransferase